MLGYPLFNCFGAEAMSGQSDQPRWFVKLDGSSRDIDAVKQSYSAGVLDIEELGGERLLSAPRFAGCESVGDVMAEATELLANVNTAMSIASDSYGGLGIGGVVEHTATGRHRTVFIGIANEASFAMAMSAHLIGPDGQRVPAGPPPQRSSEERLTDIMDRDDRVREAALELAGKPVSWPSLYVVFETVKRVLAQEGKELRDTGWISKTEARQFGATADYYRHGHPRRPIPSGKEMPQDDATKLVKRLFHRMVDHLQPN